MLPPSRTLNHNIIITFSGINGLDLFLVWLCSETSFEINTILTDGLIAYLTDISNKTNISSDAIPYIIFRKNFGVNKNYHEKFIKNMFVDKISTNMDAVRS